LEEKEAEAATSRIGERLKYLDKMPAREKISEEKKRAKVTFAEHGSDLAPSKEHATFKVSMSRPNQKPKVSLLNQAGLGNQFQSNHLM
jgi:hypothetical protein